MNLIAGKKPQITSSILTMFEGCGEAGRRRYGARFGWNDREEIIPPAVVMIIGSAVDKAVTTNLQSVIDKKGLLKVGAVQEVAFKEASLYFQDPENVLWKEEEVIDQKKTVGDAIDMAVTLSSLHATELAPHLAPKMVQEKWVIELNDYPVNLSGQIDIVEEHPGPEGSAIIDVRDTKTVGQSPNKNAADVSEQLSMYSLAKKIQGIWVNTYYLDFLVKLKTPVIKTQSTFRDDGDHRVLMHRVEALLESFEKGVFLPARRDDWRCTPSWCGYWSSCKFGGKR